MCPECFPPLVSSVFYFSKTESCCVTQAEVQWRNLGSVQSPLPGLNDSPASASQVAGTSGVRVPPCPANFCIFSRDRVSPC